MYEVKRRTLLREFDMFFKFNNGEIGLIRHTLEENGLRETSHGNWNLLWSIGPLKEEVYRELKPYQKVFEDSLKIFTIELGKNIYFF
jgi:hypothetical protein